MAKVRQRAAVTAIPLMLLCGLIAMLVRPTGGRVAAQDASPDMPDAAAHSAAAPDVDAAGRSEHVIPPAGDLQLPAGQRALKIEIDSAGIYQLDYFQLRDAGMQPANLNPATLQMMSRGRSVAYQFIGDDDARFEPGEFVRFYGWGIENRYERLYLDNNVFWLWGNGTATRAAAVNNGGGFPLALSWTSTITYEQDLFFTPTYINWTTRFENPPDAWYWDYLDIGLEYTYALTVPNPAASGPPAQYVVELFSRNQYDNSAVAALAGDDSPAVRAWSGKRSVNITGTLPIANLQNGVNTLALTTGATGNGDRHFNFNRATLTYERRFQAIDDALLVTYSPAGNWTFRVNNLPPAAAVMAWDVSDRFAPRLINVGHSNNTGQARVASSVPAERALHLYVAAESALKTPVSLTRYTSPALAPAAGATWLAIAHADLITETRRLAAYRAAADGMATHVVDIADVTNVYGHGLATPQAIKRYAQHAYDAWGLEYLLLVGDATQNPRHKRCVIEAPACLLRWNGNLNQPNLIVTDLVFDDRFLGLVPTDYSFTLLDGGDELPDIAIGRLPARTAAEARAMIDKTIRYDSAVRAEEAWLERILFLADNTDAAGDFCRENRDIYNAVLPEPYLSAVQEQCLDDYLAEGKTATDFRNDLFNHLADISGPAATHPGIVNYRGHGGLNDWAAGTVRSDRHADLWANYDFPVVILSADCLDGHFAWLGVEGLGETFLRLADSADGRMLGSAAHWGSTGLGYSFEHTVLHREFYVALFRDNAQTIGRAVNGSKRFYVANKSGHLSEAYTMTLHGDPALRLPQPPATHGVTAAVDRPTAQAQPGRSVVYTLTITNTGNRNDTFQLSVNSPWPAQLAATTLANVAPGTAVTLTLTHSVPTGALRLATRPATVSVRSQADNSVTQTITVTTGVGWPQELFLPVVRNGGGNAR